VNKFKLLTWNVGFCGGRDGLKGRVGTRSDVMHRLSGIATVLSDVSADVVCLQEIDRCSKRSFYIDQIDYLATAAGYPYKAFVQTWRSPWIPYPLTWRVDRQFGPMDAGQVILSRHPIVWHAHITHPKPNSRSGLLKYFYLDRVSQFVSLDLGLRQPVVIGHVHLEAFDTDARMAQAEIVSRLIQSWGTLFKPMMLCGDFNALPQVPGAVYIFDDEPGISYEKDTTLASFSDKGLLSAGIGTRYQDYPADAPDRQLSHVFYDSELRLDAYTLLQTGEISDHLPGVADYRVVR